MLNSNMASRWRLVVAVLGFTLAAAKAPAADTVIPLVQTSQWEASSGFKVAKRGDALVFAAAGSGERCAVTKPMAIGPNTALVLLVYKLGEGTSLKIQLYFRKGASGPVLEESSVQANETAVTAEGLTVIPLWKKAPTGATTVAVQCWGEGFAPVVGFGYICLANVPERLFGKSGRDGFDDPRTAGTAPDADPGGYACRGQYAEAGNAVWVYCVEERQDRSGS